VYFIDIQRSDNKKGRHHFRPSPFKISLIFIGS
jgi:hypothetical protein